MHRILPTTAVAAALLLLTACAPAAETPSASSPSAVADESPTPTPTPTAPAGEAFGSTVTIDYAGSVWAITVDQPTTVRPEVVDMFPLDDPTGTEYVTVPGTIERVSGEPMEPSSEVSVSIVVDNKSVEPEYLGTGDAFPGATYSLPETFAGGSAPFEQVFIVPAGSVVNTVSVVVGMGEAGQRVFFGEAPDLGNEYQGDSESADVESMKYVWGESTQEQRNETLSNAGVTKGGPVTDAAVAYVVERSNSVGIILDDDEAREFLEWAVQQ